MSNSKTISELLDTARQLSDREFEEFYKKIQDLHSKKGKSYSTIEEDRLLQKIKKGLPSRIWLRWNYLIARRDSAILTPDEYGELLALTETVEKYDFQRLKWMAKLAEIRDISLDKIPQQFGLTPS